MKLQCLNFCIILLIMDFHVFLLHLCAFKRFDLGAVCDSSLLYVNWSVGLLIQVVVVSFD